LNPCFLRLRPVRSWKGFIREDSERVSGHGNAWMALDVISFVIGWRSVWRRPKSQYLTACFRDENGRQRLMCYSRASSSSLVVLQYRPKMTILPLRRNCPFCWNQFSLTTSFASLSSGSPRKLGALICSRLSSPGMQPRKRSWARPI